MFHSGVEIYGTGIFVKYFLNYKFFKCINFLNFILNFLCSKIESYELI